MTSPTPPIGLSGTCSVIQDEVLYSYSSAAFQSLPLHTNGTWSKLPNGVPVSGASCVLQQGVALWVVGGVPAASSSGSVSYPGLQKYSFDTKTWATITPLVLVTESRQSHAAVYLEGLESILVYAGSQSGDSIPTTDTFVISTQSPYSVKSYSARNTPAISPLLLAWDSSSAITIGGSANNQNIYRFQIEDGWQKIFPGLPAPLKSSNLEQATLIEGTDNSRVLQLYDLSVSPTNVSQIVLQNSLGRPARQGRYIGQSQGKKRKRGLALNDWPSYNGTNAPTATRSGFSLARNAEGTVSISGGGDTNQSVALFNENNNSWINTTTFFGASADQKPLIQSSSSTRFTSSSMATSSPTSTSPPPPPAGGDGHPRASLILGATLGSILGFIALLIIVLLLLRWRRRKEAQKRFMQEQEDDSDDEKDRMSIVDRGDPFIKETVGPTYPASQQSLSVYEGTEGQQVLQQGQQPSHQRSATRGSDNSTTMLVPKKIDMYEMSPIREKKLEVPSPVNEASSSSRSLQVPGAKGQPKRSSGWSRYFSGNDTMAANRTSDRSSNRDPDLIAGDTSRPGSNVKAYNLPPLDMGQQFHEGDVNRQVTGKSPSTVRPVSSITLQRPSEERPRTISSTFSTVGPSTAPSIWSNDGMEETTNWTPMTRNEVTMTPRMRNTASSSVYGAVGEGSRMSTSSRVVSGAQVMPQTVEEDDDNNNNNHMQQLARLTAARVVEAPVVREPQQAVVHEDMSWLNLGSEKK